MKAYSYDLRQRVLRAVDQGQPRTEIVVMFAISLATLKRYLKRQREMGDVRAKPIPGRPARKGAALLAGLQPQLDVYPDATLEEHCQIWKTTQGVQVSTASMSRAIRRLNWTRKKKTLRASEQKSQCYPSGFALAKGEWAKRSSLRGLRIGPSLRSIWNRFLLSDKRQGLC